MTRSLRTLFLTAVVTTAVAVCAAAQSLPKAESILDRYVEITGGKSAYQKLNREVMQGTIAFAAQGLSGTLTRYSAAPAKEYSVVELGQLGKIESGVVDGVAWERSAILGVRVKSGEEKEQSLRTGRFNSTLDWRKIYAKAETLGTEVFANEDCYKVRLTPLGGRPEMRYYSRKSGLLLRTTTTAVSQLGDVEVEVLVSDYKKFGGILYPTHSRQKAGGQELEITVTNVLLNQPIPAEQFLLPDDVKAALAPR